MAIRNFTKTARDASGKWQFSKIDTAAAANNRLIDTDVTANVQAQGVFKIYAYGTYVKGSSTNGKIDLVVDGNVVASSTVLTADGSLTITATVPVYETVALRATITGTATGASVNFASIALTNPEY
jgi:hypothetical protein